MKENQSKRKQSISRILEVILGILIGMIWSSGIAYATTVAFYSNDVEYDNTASGLESTNVQDALDELYIESSSYQLFEDRVSVLESQVYPVGSIYISVTKSTTAQVASLFGGKWCEISQGRTLIGAGTSGTFTFTIGSTGSSTDAGNRNSATPTISNPKGEYTHQLNTNEMPSHHHSIGFTTTEVISTRYTSGTNNFIQIGNVSRTSTSSGGSSYHNNIQPYLAVYMYKRIEDTASC